MTNVKPNNVCIIPVTPTDGVKKMYEAKWNDLQWRQYSSL